MDNKEYITCPAIEKGVAKYSILNPEVVLCSSDYCPHIPQKISWNGEDFFICLGKLKRDVSDKIKSLDLKRKSNSRLQTNFHL